MNKFACGVVEAARGGSDIVPPVVLTIGPSEEVDKDCVPPACESEYPMGTDLTLELENVGRGCSVEAIENFCFFFGFFPGNVDEGLRPRLVALIST